MKLKTLFLLAVMGTGLASSLYARPPKVLILVPQYYGANFYLISDEFEKNGWEVLKVGLSRYVAPCPAYAGPLGCTSLRMDSLVNEITDIASFDILCLAPVSQWASTPPCADLLNNSAALNLVKSAADSGLVVAAFCSGVRVLASADVIRGKRVTGHQRFASEYMAAGALFVGNDAYPVVSGRIVTAVRGQFYSVCACDAMARLIDGSSE